MLNRYPHLNDHLNKMKSLPSRNDVLKEIDELPFSALSLIVLEARAAIIEKVKIAIPNNATKILFLTGKTGSGKSTTLHYLAGHELELDHFAYKLKNNKESYIGHNDAKSCTFLPNIEIINDLVLVDFPGFDDTNGTLISLATEFALKALITEYHPQILVLESITNDAGRYAAAAEQGRKLSRLIDNTEDCTLGITKYSQDSDFGRIEYLKQQQKQELTDEYKSKKREFTVGIKTLTNHLQTLTNPQDRQTVQEHILDNEAELADLKKQKTSQPPLNETKAILARRKHLEEKEKELLKQINLGQVEPIRFSNLENQDQLKLRRKQILESSRQPVQVNPTLAMDYDHESLLKERFTNDLMKELNTGNVYNGVKFTDLDSFKACVAEYSLMYAIAAPEISSFLHLPEMDPKVLNKFDEQLISNCISKHRKSLFDLCYRLRTITSFLNKTQETNNVKILRKQITNLENFVKGICGLNDNEKWEKALNTHSPITDPIDQLFKLPEWVKLFSYESLVVPNTIYSVAKNPRPQEIITNETLEKFSLEIKQIMNQALIYPELMSIQRIISNRSDKKTNNLSQNTADQVESPETKLKKLLAINEPAIKPEKNADNSISKEFRQEEYRKAYEKQLARRTLLKKLVIASAFIPPLLLITIPLWFIAKHFEKIKKVSISVQEENEIRLKRKEWKSTHGLLKIKDSNAISKYNPEQIITKYVDLGRLKRDTLFKTKETRQISKDEIEKTQQKSAAIFNKITRKRGT